MRAWKFLLGCPRTPRLVPLASLREIAFGHRGRSRNRLRLALQRAVFVAKLERPRYGPSTRYRERTGDLQPTQTLSAEGSGKNPPLTSDLCRDRAPTDTTHVAGNASAGRMRFAHKIDATPERPGEGPIL